jgi:ribbon-helix-helix CopG family protein
MTEPKRGRGRPKGVKSYEPRHDVWCHCGHTQFWHYGMDFCCCYPDVAGFAGCCNCHQFNANNVKEKRGRGRPAGSGIFSLQKHIAMDQKTALKLAKLARESGLSESAVIRQLIANY